MTWWIFQSWPRAFSSLTNWMNSYSWRCKCGCVCMGTLRFWVLNYMVLSSVLLCGTLGWSLPQYSQANQKPCDWISWVETERNIPLTHTHRHCHIDPSHINLYDQFPRFSPWWMGHWYFSEILIFVSWMHRSV